MDNHQAENSCEANIIKDTLNGIIVLNDAICVNQTILLRLAWISIAGNMKSALSTAVRSRLFYISYCTKPVFIRVVSILSYINVLILFLMLHQHFFCIDTTFQSFVRVNRRLMWNTAGTAGFSDMFATITFVFCLLSLLTLFWLGWVKR